MKTLFTLSFILVFSQVLTAQVVSGSSCTTVLPSAASETITTSNSVNLTANAAPSGFTYRWYDSDGTSLMSSSQIFSTPIITASRLFYLAYHHTSTGCLTAKAPVWVYFYPENLNWVREYTSRDTLVSPYSLRGSLQKVSYKSTSYHDGLGRSAQTVQISAASDGSDVIGTVAYDAFGRQYRDYLPVPNNDPGSKGKFRSNAVSLNSSYYSTAYNDSKGYADKTFEASPLNRVVKQGVPGQAWTNRDIQIKEQTNSASEGVKIWTVTIDGLPVSTAEFATGTLTKTEVLDEDLRRMIEYKDKLGRLVLKKVQESSSPGTGHTGWMCTYYVYDTFGRLRVVMTPKAVFEIITNSQSSTSTSIRDGLYYLYSYDERGRQITKKIPDKGTEEMVYDLQDRLVAWRDANLAGQNKWLYTKYDALGREVMTGLVANSSTRQTLQATVNSLGSNNAVINATSGKTGITNAGGFPREVDGGEGEVLTVNYYDHYSFRKSTLTYSKPSTAYHDQTISVHGLLTGKLVRNLDNNTLYETAIYYDDLGRLIQTFEDHHLGGTIRSSTRFDFENKPMETVTQLSTPGSQTITKNYTYNNAGLLTAITHKINSDPAVTLVNFQYDQLGKLTNKTFPVAGNAAMNFTYNIRGWIKKINDPQVSNASNKVFAQELFYESDGTSPQYNGNISKADWRGQDDIKREYNYFYDPNNRIKDALYTVPGYSWQDGRFNIGYVNYDPNGNLTTLQRVNQQTADIWALVDNLAYSYGTHSNKLTYVYDYQTSPTYLAKDYKNLGTSTYNYDANGNLLGNSDQYSVVITYNHLNLPRSIVFSGTGRRLDYWYNAEGVKVRQVNTNGTTVTTLDYLGEFVFENNALSYIIHEEGRAAYENSAFQYEFFIKDHLGNVRQVVRNPTSNLRVATMEPENAEEEEKHFKNIKESRQGAGEHNKTPGGYATAWLNAERGRILGPSRSQEVQQGDSVELGVFGKYVDPKKVRLSPATFARTGMDRKIIRTLGEYGQNLAASPNELAIANVIALVITELQQKPAPEAYMGYALYDSDSVLYEQGKVILSKKARNKHEELIQKLAVKKDGYIETFLVNETAENVWFDQFRIMSTGPLIVQETHYDPWGVELSGIGYQYGGIKINPYLYNGKELTSGLGVIMYDYGARLYIPAIGRWFVSDPLAEKARRQSPYNYALNNPLRYIDPDGMEAYSVMGTPVITGETEPEDPLVKSVVNGEESDPGLCQNCSSLPEVVVTGERINDNRQEGIKINGYWGASTSSLNDLGIIQQQPIGGTVPFLPGGIGGWGNIKNFFSAIKNFRSFFNFGKNAISANRLHHIFGKSEHALESLVNKFGSEAKAYNAVQKAADLAAKTGKLTPNANGILPSGSLGNIINVGGMNVRLIGGRVENGKVVISSFSRKGL
jgi:RHS repeat-associated protein